MKRIHPDIRLLVLLILGGFGITFLVCPHCTNSLYQYTMASLYSVSVWVFLWFGNDKMAHILNNKISWVTSPVKRLFWGLLSTVVYTLGIMYILKSVFNAITDFDIQFNTEILTITLVITFGISIFMHGRMFLLNWRQAALDAETLRKESAMARYDALKSQINPHFLFNSLNALTNLVYEDQDKAARFIKQLSEVYRYVLDTREKELVLLVEELRFVKAYLFLQQIRFGDNLNIELEVEDENGQVAPLALQLLLENAIKHNVISKEQPLNIRLYRDGDYIVVENSLQPKTLAVPATPGLGLENIRRRYSFLTSREVVIHQTADRFAVRIPVISVEA
ncbi:MAG: histidine kinase [Bacteroidetes bacterium]|nr:histidine kinase [Bacteroidota bacterium]MBS1978813.1 histidine kinase [Bacteroidota bacterium]